MLSTIRLVQLLNSHSFPDTSKSLQRGLAMAAIVYHSLSEAQQSDIFLILACSTTTLSQPRGSTTDSQRFYGVLCFSEYGWNFVPTRRGHAETRPLDLMQTGFRRDERRTHAFSGASKRRPGYARTLDQEKNAETREAWSPSQARRAQSPDCSSMVLSNMSFLRYSWVL